VAPPSEFIYVSRIISNLPLFYSISELLAFVKNCNLVFFLLMKKIFKSDNCSNNLILSTWLQTPTQIVSISDI